MLITGLLWPRSGKKRRYLGPVRHKSSLQYPPSKVHKQSKPITGAPCHRGPSYRLQPAGRPILGHRLVRNGQAIRRKATTLEGQEFVRFLPNDRSRAIESQIELCACFELEFREII